MSADEKCCEICGWPVDFCFEKPLGTPAVHTCPKERETWKHALADGPVALTEPATAPLAIDVNEDEVELV